MLQVQETLLRENPAAETVRAAAARDSRRLRRRPDLVQQCRCALRPLRPALRRLRGEPPLHPLRRRDRGRDRGRRLPGPAQGAAAGGGGRASEALAADPASRAGLSRRAAGRRPCPRHPGRRHPADQLHHRRRAGLGLHPQLGQAPALAAHAHDQPRLRRYLARLSGHQIPRRSDARAARDGRDRPPGGAGGARLRHAGPLLGHRALSGAGSRLRHGVRRSGTSSSRPSTSSPSSWR